MKEIRMDDIWQKLMANIIGIQLREELSKELKGYNIINEKKVSDVIGDSPKINKGETLVSIKIFNI